jgi:ribosomal-protein-alanine N-acetyltransferase
MIIRRMKEADVPQVEVIEQANFSRPWDAASFLEYLQKEDAAFLVAEEAGRILGYCGMIAVPDEGDVTNVAVDETLRHRGIGYALVREMQKAAWNLGVRRLFLEVREGNAPAAALYEKAGFCQVGLRKNYYSGPTENARIMVCELSEDNMEIPDGQSED